MVENEWVQRTSSISITIGLLSNLLQGCHSYKFSKFPDFSLTQLYFSLTG